MKAKDGVVDRLNNILTVELTAINQYFLQAEMCLNWGYERLYNKFREISTEEMKDSEHMIKHILYLEGMPNVQRMGPVMIGESVQENLDLDLASEKSAVELVTEAITHCTQVADYTTRNILENMVRSEEEHVDWLETQLETINQIGIDLYLNQQIKNDG